MATERTVCALMQEDDVQGLNEKTAGKCLQRSLQKRRSGPNFIKLFSRKFAEQTFLLTYHLFKDQHNQVHIRVSFVGMT